MKQISLANITVIASSLILVIIMAGCDKNENGEEGKIDPPSRELFISGDFILKQNGVEVQTVSAKLEMTRLNDSISMWNFDALTNKDVDFFPMKIDSVIERKGEGMVGRTFIAKDQIPEINSNPGNKYKMTSFAAFTAAPYIVVDMNIGSFSVNYKGSV